MGRKLKSPGFGLFIPKKPSQNWRMLSAPSALAPDVGSSSQASSMASITGSGSEPMMEVKCFWPATSHQTSTASPHTPQAPYALV